MVQALHIVERTPTRALQHVLKKYDISLPDGLLQDTLTLLIQSLMEIDVSQHIDALRYERANARRAYRNGYRESAWIINQKNIPLRIPKLRQGTYSPDFLNHPMIEAEFLNIILQAYIEEPSFTNLTNLLDTLDINAHPSQISALESDLYDLIEAYKNRLLTPLTIQLDIVPIDDNGRKRYLALAFDDLELLDHDITSDADDQFWQDFVRRLEGRVIHGVEYVLVSRVHTVVRYSETSSPNMKRVA